MGPGIEGNPNGCFSAPSKYGPSHWDFNTSALIGQHAGNLSRNL